MRVDVVPSARRRSSYRHLFEGFGTRGRTVGLASEGDGGRDQRDAEGDVEGELAAVAHGDLNSLAHGDEQRYHRRAPAAARAPVDDCYQQLNEPGDGDAYADRLVNTQRGTGAVEVDAGE